MDSPMIDSTVEMKIEEWRKQIYDPKLTPFGERVAGDGGPDDKTGGFGREEDIEIGTVEPEEPPGPAVYAVPYGIVATLQSNIQVHKDVLVVRPSPFRLFLFSVGKKN
ncbi:MAG: hypothetical protein Q9204_008683 [Flavoplaca sp. TL-2023a]